MQELQKTGSTPDLIDTEEAHRLLRRIIEHEPLSTDEAVYVWHTMHRVMNAVPGLSVLMEAWDQMTLELSKGERCAVCGRYKDKNCWTEC